MEDTSPAADRPLRIPRIAWIAGAGLLAALVAITVFNVPLNTVVYYGFIILMIGGHFFMHGSHGGHAGHGQHANPSTANEAASPKAAQDVTGAAPSEDKQARRSGGCH